ncbi:hypothetical protein KDD17_09310 [Sulfitobacter albidus]|uniref:Cellulose-binding protein n=1 Tax=Sulfitobacter albidus TaxID=2829501 RepID=A0A975JB47_9RHOB|nr:hypothetical protein [Sulfitobacter albidus]QUJ75219.1 hypothetical protein KDD17_09310 [Sulfitobacter albidus]
MSDLASTVFSVIMVGHSLFGTTGPDMLDAALSARAGEARVQAQIINGAPLKYNWDQSQTAQGIDARRVLPQAGATDLILTEAIPLANHLRWSETGVYAQAFAGLAWGSNPDAWVWVQEGWHSLNSGTGVEVPYDEGAATPWRVRLQEDLADWEGIVDALRAGRDATQVQLIPAGQALGALSDAIAAGDVPGLDDISQVFDDDIHLATVGHYFVSMVQFAALTGSDPQGLPHVVKDRFGSTVEAADAAQAAALQRIAARAVADYRGQAVSPAPAPAAAEAAPRAPPVAQSTLAPPEPAALDTPAPAPGRMGLGLAPVTDWSTQQPFLDVMKTARPWIGHLAGQFGGIEYDELVAQGHIDAEGWVTSLPRNAGSVGTLILTDLPEAAQSLAGRYVLRYKGRGVVEPKGRVANVRYAPGEVRFDFTPGPGTVEIRIQRTSASDPVRRITVVREEHLDLWARGAVFNPAFLRRLEGFDNLRFMDWMETNNSQQSAWADRPKLSDASWAHHGVPLEVMLALAGTVGADAWFNMPHLADDGYVRAFAQAVRDTLPEGRRAYVEYSNEVWNFQFEQTKWADAQARALWGQNDVGTQFYARRAAEVARIWTQVFADAPQRLVNVISTQTGWLGLEENILNAPLVVADGTPAPKEAFDAYAITGYFGGVLGLQERRDEVHGWLGESLAQAAEVAAAQGLTGQARQEAMDAARHVYANAVAGQELADGSVSGNAQDTVADLAQRVFPYHARVARDAGLDLIMYEGGSHVVGIGPQVNDERLTAFFQDFNYSAEMGALYAQLIAGWRAAGGGLFTAYADIYAPTKWGSWGALRHLDDANPRWNALVAAR